MFFFFFYYFIQVSSLQYRKLDFNEFAAAAISVYQMEGLETWEHHARTAFDIFDQEGNRPIMIEELASVWSIT
jgi:kinase